MNKVLLSKEEKETFILVLKSNKSWFTEYPDIKSLCKDGTVLQDYDCTSCPAYNENWGDIFKNIVRSNRIQSGLCGSLSLLLLYSIDESERNEILLEALI